MGSFSDGNVNFNDVEYSTTGKYFVFKPILYLILPPLYSEWPLIEFTSIEWKQKAPFYSLVSISFPYEFTPYLHLGTASHHDDASNNSFVLALALVSTSDFRSSPACLH